MLKISKNLVFQAVKGHSFGQAEVVFFVRVGLLYQTLD